MTGCCSKLKILSNYGIFHVFDRFGVSERFLGHVRRLQKPRIIPKTLTMVSLEWFQQGGMSDMVISREQPSNLLFRLITLHETEIQMLGMFQNTRMSLEYTRGNVFGRDFPKYWFWRTAFQICSLLILEGKLWNPSDFFSIDIQSNCSLPKKI